MQPLRSIFIYHKNHPPFHSTATCLPNKHIEYTPITPSFYSFSDAFFFLVLLDLKPDDVRNSRCLWWEMMTVIVKRMKESGSLLVQVKSKFGFC